MTIFCVVFGAPGFGENLGEKEYLPGGNSVPNLGFWFRFGIRMSPLLRPLFPLVTDRPRPNSNSFEKDLFRSQAPI